MNDHDRGYRPRKRPEHWATALGLLAGALLMPAVARAKLCQPEAWYKLDETSGAAVVDATGNGHGGMAFDVICTSADCSSSLRNNGWVAGRHGGGLSLDGRGQVDRGWVGSRVQIPDHDAFTPTFKGFTISAWVNYRSMQHGGSGDEVGDRGPIVTKNGVNDLGIWEWQLG